MYVESELRDVAIPRRAYENMSCCSTPQICGKCAEEALASV